MMANPVVYFEFPAENVARARKFYETVFGWTSENWGSNYYSLDTTGRSSEGIDGGVYKRTEKSDQVTVYIKVPSVDKFLSDAEKNGGEVVTEKTSMGEWGSYAVFRDPEGNLVGLHEFSETKKAKKK